jgi:hypothetical protein
VSARHLRITSGRCTTHFTIIKIRMGLREGGVTRIDLSAHQWVFCHTFQKQKKVNRMEPWEREMAMVNFSIQKHCGMHIRLVRNNKRLEHWDKGVTQFGVCSVSALSIGFLQLHDTHNYTFSHQEVVMKENCLGIGAGERRENCRGGRICQQHLSVPYLLAS